VEILILNGPNLNLLGTREPEIYGSQTMEDVVAQLRRQYATLDIAYFQTNHEGDIIDKLHEVGFSYTGIILNAGGYTHTSISIRDAISAITTPVIEVHISDLRKREKFRHHSYMKEVCVHQIVGRGVAGYGEAVNFLLR